MKKRKKIKQNSLKIKNNVEKSVLIIKDNFEILNFSNFTSKTSITENDESIKYNNNNSHLVNHKINEENKTFEKEQQSIIIESMNSNNEGHLFKNTDGI